jgi:hypothetical protein
MTATMTKTAAYNPATATKLFAEAAALPTPAERLIRRMEIADELQRAWVKGGRKGTNPTALYSGF